MRQWTSPAHPPCTRGRSGNAPEISCDSTKLPVSIEVWELQPGSSEGSRVHEGEGALEEFYYFIAGRAVMWIDGEELPVGPGGSVMAPPGVDHGLRSTGKEPLNLISA